MIASDFWSGKRVFVTGHTGFKGSWLALWLQSLGAEVTGFALAPPTTPSLFQLASVGRDMVSHEKDIRDSPALVAALRESRAEILLHLAAQPLVRLSYRDPVETYSTNVMGTLCVLEAARQVDSVRVLVNVTTDKCYENREWHWGYREDDRLGGHDPYSSSKACAEILTAAYRSSYFPPDRLAEHGRTLASARAGNVIGGGDWAADRLIPDCVRAVLAGERVLIRNPGALRPWQHVLEPLAGYLVLAERLFSGDIKYMKSYNFGPDDADVRPVEEVVRALLVRLGAAAQVDVETAVQPHEAGLLKLDCSLARAELGWKPVWNLGQTLDRTAEWVQEYRSNVMAIRRVCLDQIVRYSAEAVPAQ